MANATTNINLVPVTTYEEKKSFTLELDELEAKVLISILRRVGGCHEKSYRKQAGAMLSALHDLDELHGWNEYLASGVGHDLPENLRVVKGGIYFNDVEYME